MRKIFTLLITVFVLAFAAFALVQPPSKAETKTANVLDIAHTQSSAPVRAEKLNVAYSPPVKFAAPRIQADYKSIKTRSGFAHKIYYPPEQLE